MKQYSLDRDGVLRSISEKRYVSFDIFDTLIIRPYVRPTDLFRHIERLTKREGFAKKRHDAEMSVRRQLGREITIQEIYDAIPEYRDLMQTEIDMEIKVSCINPEIYDLIQEILKMEKSIILISDMYLSKDTIAKILENCNFTDYDSLFVSSEYRVSKHTGELYDLVLKQLNISPKEIFHIGDNKRSDHDIPEIKGINSYLYIKPLDQYKRTHKEEYALYRHDRSLDNSILIGMDILHHRNNGLWYDIGYKFGGPLANSYSLFILNGLKNDQTILFASRDGYNLKRIFDSVYNIKDTHYVYVQRIIMDVLTEHKIGYGPIDVPNKNSDRYGYESTVNAMKHIINYFSEELDLKENMGRDEIPRFFNENVSAIDRLRKDRLRRYREYLTEICQNKDICLVDCTTMKYSSQRLVETALGRKIYGCYTVTIEDNKDFNFRSMHMKKGLMLGWSSVNIPEFFLSSPEFPLIKWNGKPVHAEGPECEVFRSSIYDKVSDGEVAYAEDFNRIFGKYAFPLDYVSVVNWSKLSAVRGTESCEALRKIKWASDPDHLVYQSLVLDGSTLLYYLKNSASAVITKLNDR